MTFLNFAVFASRKVSAKLLSHEHSLEFITDYSLCQAAPPFLFYILVLKFNLYGYHYCDPYVFTVSSFVPAKGDTYRLVLKPTLLRHAPSTALAS